MNPCFFISVTKQLKLSLAVACCLITITWHKASGAFPKQHADSLEQLYLRAGDTQKQKLLQELILLYLPEKPELALHKNLQALEVANRIPSPYGQIFALSQLGNSVRFLLHDYDSALYYYKEALVISRRNSLQQEQLDILLTTGDIYQEVGNSYKTIEHYMQAQALAESLQIHPMAAEALNSSGRVYASIGNESKAIRYHSTALKLSLAHQYGKGIADSHYWLGMAYQNKGNLNLALQQLQLATDLREQMDDQPGLGQCELTTGRIFLLQKEYPKAEAILNKGLNRLRQLGLITEQANAYNLIGLLQIE